MLTSCGSCGREVELEDPTCSSCGGPISLHEEALVFARAYRDEDEQQRLDRWRSLSDTERDEVARLLPDMVRPARRRQPAVLLALAGLAVAGVVLALALLVRFWQAAPSPDLPQNPLASFEPPPKPVLRVATVAADLIPSVCGAGLVVLESAAGRERTELRREPRAESGRVPTVEGDGGFVFVDRNTRLRVTCRQSGWARVEVEQPPRFRGAAGWLESSALERRVDDVGREVRSQLPQITWTSDMRPHQRQILMALDRALSRNPRCRTLDPSSLSSARRNDRTVYFVVCNPAADAYNLWFDLESPPVEQSTPISAESATSQCEDAARQIAAPAERVVFDHSERVILEYPRGIVKLVSRFFAGGDRGQPGDYRVMCVFENGRLADMLVAE